MNFELEMEEEAGAMREAGPRENSDKWQKKNRTKEVTFFRPKTIIGMAHMDRHQASHKVAKVF